MCLLLTGYYTFVLYAVNLLKFARFRWLYLLCVCLYHEQVKRLKSHCRAFQYLYKFRLTSRNRLPLLYAISRQNQPICVFSSKFPTFKQILVKYCYQVVKNCFFNVVLVKNLTICLFSSKSKTPSNSRVSYNQSSTISASIKAAISSGDLGVPKRDSEGSTITLVAST